MEGTESGTSNSTAELNRIASGGHVSVIEVVLTMGMPLRLACDPLTIGREVTELSVAAFYLQGTFLTAEYMIPSLINRDATGKKVMHQLEKR